MPGAECITSLRTRRNSKWEQRQRNRSRPLLQVTDPLTALWQHVLQSEYQQHLSACICSDVWITKHCVRVSEVKRELVLEKSPKWEALTEVLQEIERENKSSQHEPGQSSVLLKCYKGPSCQQCVSSLFSGFAYVVLYYQNVMETSF